MKLFLFVCLFFFCWRLYARDRAGARECERALLFIVDDLPARGSAKLHTSQCTPQLMAPHN